MKKFLFGAVLLSFAAHCPAETKQALTLHMTSGARIHYFLDAEPELTFSGQTMIVADDNGSADYPFADVKNWELGMVEYSGMPDIGATAAPSIEVYGNTVTVYNPTSEKVTVHALDGRLIAEGSQQVETFTLPTGIHVITIANNSYKIAIR